MIATAKALFLAKQLVCMHNFSYWAQAFSKHFSEQHFPAQPANLYEPCNYFLAIGGKRVRPVLCLMANDLFDELHPSAWQVATAIELFHNFTLVHDDIMDAATLRRGLQTVHTKYNVNTAILGGDVMLIKAYEYLAKVQPAVLPTILHLFNTTATEVCEGQQLDVDFEAEQEVSLESYIRMITLKTSVLLAASLEMGAMLGGTSEGNRRHLYEFGKNLGIAFQIQDDYLDAFGDPASFGKEVGGDIKQNKKTFLWIHTQAQVNAEQQKLWQELQTRKDANKIAEVLELYRATGADVWCKELQDTYYQKAMQHLEAVAVVNARKQHLMEVAQLLMNRTN
jgi:geranylgeranyl diphosphate synthase, type II